MRRYCILSLMLLAACTTKKEKIPTETSMQPGTKIVIYQMMTRLFGNTVSVNKPYGTLEENGVGKFNDINDKALQGIKELGISHVWYTGVLEHATLTDYTAYGIPLDDADIVKGRAGSPYSIKDYYDVNPDLAVNVPDRLKEFEQLIERTHNNGLKVIIDFVPNHVARNYKSDAKPAGVRDFGEDDDKTARFKPSNNFYYLVGQSFQPPKDYNSLGKANTHPTKDLKFEEVPAKVTGNDQFTATPGVNEWFEAVKLNYGVDIENGRKTFFDPIPDTWNKMRDILVYWANKKIDGFRCDMAEMVPVEFWNWVIPQVKTVNPEIIFIAEIYNPAQYNNYIQTGRFDYLYDKVQLYDTLRDLLGGKKSTRDIGVIQKSLEGINAQMLHFLENHDEQRIASPQFAGDATRAIPAMVVSATIDQGPVMIYFGQEVGEPGAGAEGFSGNDGRTTHFDYWGVPEHQKWVNGGKFDGGQLSDIQLRLRKFYATLLSMAKDNPAITQGKYFDLTEKNFQAGNIDERVHVFVRVYENERLLIVSNFSGLNNRAVVRFTDDVAAVLNLVPQNKYLAKDLLWGIEEIPIENLSAEVQLPPYSSFIFKIQ